MPTNQKLHLIAKNKGKNISLDTIALSNNESDPELKEIEPIGFEEKVIDSQSEIKPKTSHAEINIHQNNSMTKLDNLLAFDGKNPRKGGLFNKGLFNKKEIKNRIMSLLGRDYPKFESLTSGISKSHEIKIEKNILLADSYIDNNTLQKIIILIDVNRGKFYVSILENKQNELTIYSEESPISDHILDIIAEYFNETNGKLYNYIVEDSSITILQKF